MALEVVDVLIRDIAVPNDPVAGVVVRVYDVTGTTLITSGTTAGDGHVSFLLDGAASPIRYQLRTYKQGIAIEQPKYVDIYTPPASSPTGTNNFRIDAEVFTLPPAVDPKLCRVSGYIKDPAGRPKRGIDIHFIHRFNPLIVGEDADAVGVLGERVAHRTDKDGYFQIDLWRNGCYRAIIESHENVGRSVHIPDLAAANINLVLFPRVYGCVFDPVGPWNIGVGQQLVVGVQTQLTSGYVIDGTAPEDLIYTVSPGSVAVALEVRDDALVFRGLAPGAATLSIQRVVQNLAYDPDNPVIGDGTTITVV